jgi:VWFA-related protein
MHQVGRSRIFENGRAKIKTGEGSMAQLGGNRGLRKRIADTLAAFILALVLIFAAGPVHSVQADTLQTQSQSQSGGNPSQTQQPANSQSQDIPDAPSTVQPPAPKLPQPTPEDVARPPQQDQPPANPSQPGADQSAPATPQVQNLPAGTLPHNQLDQTPGLYRLDRVIVNFVTIPVTVTDSSGRRVDGLRPSDFTVLENGKKQPLTYFSSDPILLSVAILLDIGMPDVAVQKINETYSALAGSLSPYDEAAIYTYSSTVSQACDFTNNTNRLTAVFDEMKLVSGRNNGPQAVNDPYSVGPTVNGVPVGGPPIAPVQTPPREAHVLNDAILRAALDLGKRDHTRRKVIFVISDGRELGSQSSYKQVLRVLETHDVEVKAVVVDTSALPVFKQAEKIHHLFLQGYSDILPKYTHATGGGSVIAKISRNAIEDAYTQITSEARNQYTLGYSPKATTGSSAYRSIEVQVDRKVRVIAKDGYYPALIMPSREPAKE